ncbi:hypothetical protein F5Y14DRAFT_424245 [Nemania sp. NC0429]|nr:hypothetical protein F5Y14DRAFT_424245 [Nemania sp. NC0429]
MVLYLSHSRFPIIGNLWHAISQVSSVAAAYMLSYGNRRKDSDVYDLVEGADTRIRLTVLPETNLIGLVELEPDSRESRSETPEDV